jgi:hypothetical protein
MAREEVIVANEPDDPPRGPSDATDYSSTMAPETQAEAEEQYPHTDDPRLHPGGGHGARVDPGMSSLHEEDVPSDPHERH